MLKFATLMAGLLLVMPTQAQDSSAADAANR